MSTEVITEEHTAEVADAIRVFTEAITTYGQPVYCAKVPVRIQNLVPLAIRKELLATAKVSDGWSKDIDGSFVKGRLDFRSVIITWAKDKVFQQVTVKDIAEATGASQNIVRDVISDRPDIFRKSEGWTYEIRDPQADRKVRK